MYFVEWKNSYDDTDFVSFKLLDEALEYINNNCWEGYEHKLYQATLIEIELAPVVKTELKWTVKTK